MEQTPGKTLDYVLSKSPQSPQTVLPLCTPRAGHALRPLQPPSVLTYIASSPCMSVRDMCVAACMLVRVSETSRMQDKRRVHDQRRVQNLL